MGDHDDMVSKGYFQMKMLISSFILIVYLMLAYNRNMLWIDGADLWEDTVRKGPYKMRPHVNLGVLYVQKGLFEKAMAEYEKAKRLMDNFYVHYNLGIVYEKMKFYDYAIKEFRTALVLYDIGVPKVYSAMAYHRIARLYLKKELVNDAVMNLNKSIELNPNLHEAYNDLGVAYGKMGFFDRAVNKFQTALILNPDYAAAHYNLGITYEGMGLYKKAIDEIQIAAKLDPTDERVKIHLKEILQKAQLKN